MTDPQPPAIAVRFTSTGDFCEELVADAQKVDRGIVRLSFRTTHGVPMRSLALVASYVAAGNIVILERRCGDYMFPNDEQHKKVAEYAEQQAGLIRQACAGVSLEIRGGVYEAAA